MEDKINKTVKVGICGLGTVGSGVLKILSSNADIIAARAMKIEVARVAEKDFARAKDLLDRAGLSSVPISEDWHELINDENIDIVVEVIGGVKVAKDIITAALLAGKSVVTANKDLMAAFGGEMLHLAEQNKTDLFFEASVAGGIPVIQAVKESLAGNRILQVMGIVNGTTNYILTNMAEQGSSFKAALKEAQELGYAEADPTNDVEGYDAARKIAILASIVFNSRVSDSMVATEGITNINSWDMAYAKEFGYVIKMVGIARCDGQSIEVRVHPLMLSKDHPLAAVRDSYNAVFVEGDAVEKTMFYGRGAGSLPTGSAIVGDIINAARNINHHCKSRWGCTCYKHLPIKPLSDTISKYFVRLNVCDRPGVFAAITNILSEESVSIATVMQKRRTGIGEAEIVLITHLTPHAAIEKAISRIVSLDCVFAATSIIRVEDSEE